MSSTMKWFTGSIADAVQTSKVKNSLFVVYIEGPDDVSKTFTNLLTGDVAEKLNGVQFTTIKIDANTDSYKQFAQIYKIVPVPSLFFIGKQGMPIEILGKVLDKASLMKKIDDTLAKHAEMNVQTTNEPSTSVTPEEIVEKDLNESNEKETPSTSEIVCDNGVCKLVPKTEEKPENTAAADDKITFEERLAKAKQLAEEQRKKRERDEKQQEKQREIERRKAGQEILKAQKERQENEIKNFYAQQRKEKEEERKARERILAQIEQDKKDRAAKFAPQVDAVTKAKTATSATTTDSTTAKLQFRLPDGASYTNDFPSDTKLTQVRAYVQQSLNLPNQQFNLASTFPRRQFDRNDAVTNAKTLRELELIPNAVLLVIPIHTTTVTPAYTVVTAGLIGLFWSVVTPLVHAFDYVVAWYNGRSRDEPRAGECRGNDASPSASGAPSTKRRARDTSNVHRLHDRRSDSDDENNTWNGNSTQQM